MGLRMEDYLKNTYGEESVLNTKNPMSLLYTVLKRFLKQTSDKILIYWTFSSFILEKCNNRVLRNISMSVTDLSAVL